MKRFIALNLIWITCLLSCGCTNVHNSLRPSGKSSQWNLFNRGTAKKTAPKKKKQLPPENMVVIWKDAVLEKPGTPSVRGFGARLYFHDADNEAIQVEGDLVVFGFDDSGTDGNLLSKKPTKKFVFTNEQFQTHYSESNLGASYSIWIPWDKVGQDRKTIALVPVFRTTEGNTLNGGSTTNVLPSDNEQEDDKNVIAISKKKRSKKSSTPDQVAQAGFSAERSDQEGAKLAVMSEDVSPPSGVKSTTINLTPSMASHFSTLISSSQTEKKSTEKPQHNLPALQKSQSTQRTRDSRIGGPRIAETELNQSASGTSNENEESGGTTLSAKRSPVFGAPGSFR